MGWLISFEKWNYYNITKKIFLFLFIKNVYSLKYRKHKAIDITRQRKRNEVKSFESFIIQSFDRIAMILRVKNKYRELAKKRNEITYPVSRKRAGRSQQTFCLTAHINNYRGTWNKRPRRASYRRGAIQLLSKLVTSWRAVTKHALSETWSQPARVFRWNELYLITNKVVFVMQNEGKRDRAMQEERGREKLAV